MIRQQVRRSLVEKLRDQAATYRFVWGSELSQLVPGAIAQAGGAGRR
jgi:hypothetical protein